MSRTIYLSGIAEMRQLRTTLLFYNGMISGALFLYFLLVFVHRTERVKYLDYAVLSLMILFLSALVFTKHRTFDHQWPIKPPHHKIRRIHEKQVDGACFCPFHEGLYGVFNEIFLSIDISFCR
ncbi:MAG: hypothetical protein LBT14_02960 [Treponema sp.]|jgi:hypothetical protein|nr:hypothetical protein [Treponema sp.]